ncbi:MAG: DUF1223 domain-containing protein [Pseudomonadota bacterium]
MRASASIVAGLAILSGLMANSSAQASGVCQVESGPTTAALVELYTSEGCSSCPPADEFLRKLRRDAGPQAEIIPLALHVSYWDQIGWKDVFAHKAFDARQRALVNAGKGNVVYTPQFFVNGREERNWSRALPEAIGKAHNLPAQAQIKLTSTPLTANTILVEAVAQTPAADGNRVLYIALSENELVSHVKRGENSGATLRHDATVRTWIGPVTLANGNARLRQEIALAPEWNVKNMQAIAFVQSLDDGRVLQAVSTARCGPGKRS